MAILASNFNSRSVNRDNTNYPTISNAASAWSTFMNTYAVYQRGLYEWDIEVNDWGLQKFQVAADNLAYVYLDGEYIGDAGSYNTSGNILTSTEYYNFTDIMRLTIINSDTGVKPMGVAAKFYGAVYSPLNLSSFTVAPLVAQNTTQVELLWVVQNAVKVEIDQGVGDVTGQSNITVDTYLKSNNNFQSPARKTYTIKAWGAVEEDTDTLPLEALVKNDNRPDAFEIPIFASQEPDTTIIYNVNPITGFDVPINVSGDGFVLVAEGGSSAFTSSITLNPLNQGFRIRFTTLPFNPSPDTTVNSIVRHVDVGPDRKYFQISTRAPDDAEIFDFGDLTQEVPFPVPPGNSELQTPQIQSPTTVELTVAAWQVELQDTDRVNELDGVEVRADDTDLEVRVKPLGSSWLGWQNPDNIYNTVGDQAPRLIDNMDFSPLTARSGSVANQFPTRIRTRVVGTLTAKNILES